MEGYVLTLEDLLMFGERNSKKLKFLALGDGLDGSQNFARIQESLE